MSIEGIIFGLVLIALVTLYVATPLLRPHVRFEEAAAQIGRQRERAQIYYERVLRNIRDLDEDYALGKLDEEHYQFERSLWTERGVQVLKALEQLNSGTMIAPQNADDAAIDQSLEDAVESAVKAYRQRTAMREP